MGEAGQGSCLFLKLVVSTAAQVAQHGFVWFFCGGAGHSAPLACWCFCFSFLGFCFRRRLEASKLVFVKALHSSPFSGELVALKVGGLQVWPSVSWVLTWTRMVCCVWVGGCRARSWSLLLSIFFCFLLLVCVRSLGFLCSPCMRMSSTCVSVSLALCLGSLGVAVSEFLVVPQLSGAV